MSAPPVLVVGVVADRDRRDFLGEIMIGAERIGDADAIVKRQEAERQQPVVLHLGAERQEARGQLARGLRADAADRRRRRPAGFATSSS